MRKYVSENPVHNAFNKLSTDLFTFAYKHAVKPVIFGMEPDKAHEKTATFARLSGKVTPLMGMLRLMLDYTDPILRTNVCGVDYANPFGLSAGLDKNCDMAACLDNAGFGFETVGSTTARVCAGNPRPWFHRLPQYESMLIHAGLPNDGSQVVINRVEKARLAAKTMKMSVSIARTNDMAEPSEEQGIADYVTSFRRAAYRTDMIEVNISCPNTYVGEVFTEPEPLDRLLTALDAIPRSQPVTLKMPQDKTWPQFSALLDVIVRHNVQMVTIANLRKDRTGFDVPQDWQGNMSGAPCRKPSMDLVENTYRYYGDKLAIAGVGGVFTAQQAYEKIRHGASLVMFVSSLMFRGPQEITILKRGLAELLRRDGFTSVSQAVGVDVETSWKQRARHTR